MAIRKSPKKPKKTIKPKSKSKPSKTKTGRKTKAKAFSKEKSKKKSSLEAKLTFKKSEALKPIGEVTHFFSKLGVAIVKFNTKVSLGAKLHFKGANTDFKEMIKSMQYNHQPIKETKKGQEVGIKVSEKVREGDKVFFAE